LRALTAGYTTPDDGCASYHALFEGLEELETDTHLHIHKENNILFPAVIACEQRLVNG
jgi:regulator of cell morphogenesis and NO signaling